MKNAQRRKLLALSYKDKMKALRKFVSFNYDLRKPLSGGQKSVISRYFNQMIEMNQGYKVKIYKTNNKRNLKFMQEAFHDVSKTLPGFKVAFVKHHLQHTPRVTIKGEKIIMRDPVTGRGSITIPFTDRGELITNTKGYIRELMVRSNLPKGTGMMVQTGDFFSNETTTPEGAPDLIFKWANQYAGVDFIKGLTTQDVNKETLTKIIKGR